MDLEKFLSACDRASLVSSGENGIGTLKEKSLHATLKFYFEPDENYHEIKIGSFVADIAHEKDIVEIQTGSFNVLRKKLDAYLPTHRVTLVYPIISTRYIHWIDPKTGSVDDRRKSPKKEGFHHAFLELYKIKSYLKDKNLVFAFPKLNVDDFRFLDGFGSHKKNRATKGDILPIDMIDILYIKKPLDYKKLLPKDLKQPFSTKDYAKTAKIPINISRLSLNILNHLEIVKRVGKEGNAFLYKII